MAIAFDTSSDATANPGTSVTATHTVTAGSNMLLVACTIAGGNRTGGGSCTFNGVSMTKAVEYYDFNGGVDRTVMIWILHAPATGSAYNLTYTPGANVLCAVSGLSYSGCAQTSTPDAFNSGKTTSTTSHALSVTTVADNCWQVMNCDGNTASSAGTGTTERVNDRAYDSGGAITPAGSNALTITTGGNASFNLTTVSIAPFTAGAASVSRPTLLTLGVG